MNNKILQDYHTSKLALDIMTKEVNEKKQAVTDFLASQPNKKAEIDEASFSLRAYITYEFSEVIQEKQVQIKNLQKLEISSGVAKVKSEKYSPVMRKLKK